MPTVWLTLGLLALTAVGYQLGRRRAIALVPHPRSLRSLPGYYGSFVALWVLLPCALVLLLWAVIQPQLVERAVVAGLPQEIRDQPDERLGLYLNDARNLAQGSISSREADDDLRRAADRYRRFEQLGSVGRAALVGVLGLLGLAFSYRTVRRDMPAMRRVEKAMRGILMAGSLIAIFTTLGIVLSLLFESR
jgi:phosphate transport system permease protein